MTIQILKHTADPETLTDTRVFFTLVGKALDGNYRQADFSELSGSVIGGDDIKAFVQSWLAANTIAAQLAIDTGALASNEDKITARSTDFLADAKAFVQDNPVVLNIISMDRAALETAIAGRTANQETLLLQFLTHVARVFIEERGE